MEKVRKLAVSLMLDPETNEYLSKAAKITRLSRSQFVNNYLSDLFEGMKLIEEVNNTNDPSRIRAHLKSLIDGVKENLLLLLSSERKNNEAK